jgi:hypothetical protein
MTISPVSNVNSVAQTGAPTAATKSPAPPQSPTDTVHLSPTASAKLGADADGDGDGR